MQAIPFIDLKAQQARLGTDLNQKIDAVLTHGQYIMGPEVAELEEKLCDFSGAAHTLSCSNGSDAILLSLLALGIGQGDAVFVPSFTFAATAEMVALTGATPVFVDILSDTFNIDPANLQQSIDEIRTSSELTPKAVMPVDLFGQIADYPAIVPIAEAAGLYVISDAAQGFGAQIGDRQAIEYADVVTTSFFPAKPLGCYGDGGAIQTNNDEIHNILVSLRNHGQGKDRYDNVRIGMNGRLDSIQAAVLLLKLNIFEDEIKARNKVAANYNEALQDIVTTPFVMDGSLSTWAQYTIQADNRDAIAEDLKANGIPTAVYYARPLHQQTAYQSYPVTGGKLSVTDALAETVISLPMHPYLDADTQSRIIDAVKASVCSKACIS